MRRQTDSQDEPDQEAWWQRQLSSLLWRLNSLPPVQLSLWRLERNWRLFLVVGAGILVTVVLICTVPLYSSLVLNVSLQQQLGSQAPMDRNVETTMDIAPITNLFVRDTLGETSSYASQYLQQFAPTDSWYLSVNGSYTPIETNGQKLPSQQHPTLAHMALQPYILDDQQALPHLKLISGHLLQPTSANQNPEIMVTTQLGLKPGDTISINYFKGGSNTKALTMTVAGVWSPRSLDDPYWNGNSGYFEPGSSCAGNCSTISPIFFDLDTFLADFSFDPATSAPVPFQAATLHFITFTDPARVTTSDIASIPNDIESFKNLLSGAVAATNLFVYTRLDKFVTNFQQQLSLFTQPLYIVIAQVVGLALLFVVAMASLLIEAQASDIATLKSRGASLTQLLLSYMVQGLVIALAAAFVGPYVAEGLSLAAVLFFVPNAYAALLNISIIGNLPQIVSPQLAFQPALVGALLGVAALMVAVWLAARLDVLAFRREAGRSITASFWNRSYLDLVLIGFCAVGYLELAEFGNLNVRQQLAGLGQTGATSPPGPDPFQLVAPALLLLGGGLLVLRLFPLATGAAAWAATRARGATSMLAFSQLARNVRQFRRLALLLTLAIGLGVFALTFQRSIHANALDQAKFLAGADQRVIVNSTITATSFTSLQQKYAALPGVTSISPVYRTIVTTNGGDQVGMLAINPSTFGQVAYWRADYARRPLAVLMDAMQDHQQGALAGDRQHPIWALVDTDFANQYALQSGVGFTLPLIDGSPVTFYLRVGAVVNNIPTMGNASFTGNVSISLQDYTNALSGPLAVGGAIPYYGPNEFWLRTDGNPTNDARRTRALQDPSLLVASKVDARELEMQAVDDPLASGMATLLLLGAVIAALLAVLGSVIQSQVSAKQRVAQFAILRTLGGQEPELVRILLGQQMIVYLFSLLAGTVLGLILSTATLPFLQFSTTTIDTAATHLPEYLLYFNPLGVLLFYGALVIAFTTALIIGARVAQHDGLGKALRIGED